MAYGDSKAALFSDELIAALNLLPLSATVTATKDDLSIGGATVADLAARVASDLASRPAQDGMSYQHVLITVGANEVSTLPAEAAWKANLATVIDAINAKWPAAKVYVALPWRRNYPTECNSLATWIASVISTRGAWAFVGPDERIYLENGDNGTTYTYDGIHPNAAGELVAATQWQAVMGY